MKYEEIKQIISDMQESKIDELSIEFPDGTKIKMKKNSISTIPTQVQENVQYVTSSDRVELQQKEEKQEKPCYKVVKAPMVGTFYSKSSPDAKPYVEVGNKVKKGDILCIVEAMKLMNEIESEFDGEVVEVCVRDGEMVDFGRPLFKLR